MTRGRPTRPLAKPGRKGGDHRAPLCGEQRETEEFGRVAQALVGGDKMDLAIRTR